MANAEQEVIKVRNPRSINPEKSVDVDISFDGEQFIPFAAMPDDTAGQSIYQEAIKGKYGEINISPGIEYYWSDDGWVEVVKPVAEDPNAVKRDELLRLAALRIAPLQDAADLDMATGDEKTALTAWKKYRVLLSRVDISTAPDISWPEQPAA
ncbi:tail fiber assembly protein [Phytobacter diazotrophicus]|nr:tail fiber assembly protein [Phytobacter diazotrophicus]MDC0728857.1 tail fiber assembly protein [Phytobacter diazotrophicus]MDC0736094.1 tail fiber assembly protein [Phytobacter diazotrophicus]